MQDEEEDIVGLATGQGARDVAYHLEEERDGESDKVPGSVSKKLVGVDDQGDGEESRGCNGEDG